MNDPEDLLSEDHDHVSAALDSLSDVFYVFDTDRRLVAWNDRLEAVTGYTADELHGMPPHEFVREQDLRELARYLDRVDETGSGSLEVELRTADGETIPHEIYSDALVEEDGTVVGRVGLARDVTERREYKYELEHQLERLDEFAGVLTHDLRNPLNVAQGHADLLEQELDGETPHLDAIRSAHDRIERIVSDVLDLARTGDVVTEPEPVSLASLTREVWSDVERGPSELTVEDDVAVRADASLLERMLTNLLRNAFEHAGDGVHVRVGPLGDAEGFYVEDDGPGIPPDERETVFEWKHTSKEGGLGIGLTSVEQVCDAHGWDVSVTERRDGGARFEVRDVVAPV